MTDKPLQSIIELAREVLNEPNKTPTIVTIKAIKRRDSQWKVRLLQLKESFNTK